MVLSGDKFGCCSDFFEKKIICSKYNNFTEIGFRMSLMERFHLWFLITKTLCKYILITLFCTYLHCKQNCVCVRISIYLHMMSSIYLHEIQWNRQVRYLHFKNCQFILKNCGSKNQWYSSSQMSNWLTI